MSFLKRMRISTKIFCTMGIFVALNIGLNAIGAYQIDNLAADTQRLVSHQATALHLTGSAQEHMTRMHQLVFQMNDDVAKSAPLQTRFQIEFDALKSDMAALRPILSDDTPDDSIVDTTPYDHASAGVDQYYKMELQYYALLTAKNVPAAESLLLSSGMHAFDQADGAFDELVDSQVRALAAASAHAKEQAAGTRLLMTILSALGLLFALSVGLIITRREIITPLAGMTDAMKRLALGDMDVTAEGYERGDEIGDLARAFGVFRQAAVDKQLAEADAARERANAEGERRKHEAARAQIAKEQAEVVSAVGTGLSRLASGDLSFRLKTPFPEAYEKLRDDFNGAVAQLLDAMLQIRTAALGIRSGADEISQAADDLSRRTEQQAASLEETAGAMNQITTSVRRTAEGSASANAVVIAANTDAVRSGQVVRDAVAAMSDIEHSARQISQIIGVIDEIAFQTNLLALNAGVEAARAGDAGRGFAVVASEVRALAQKSAAAAKEIKALIAKSADQVNGGVQLVGQTGQALERILNNIGEINKLVAEIAASAKEQASGLHEINSAIDQMDHVTQQNASMVEESTAASFALATESQQLAELIGRFNIGEVQAVQSPIRRLAARLSAKERNTAQPRRMRSTGGAATARKLEPEASESWEEF